MLTHKRNNSPRSAQKRPVAAYIAVKREQEMRINLLNSLTKKLLFLLVCFTSQHGWAQSHTGTINLLRAQYAATGDSHYLLVNGFTAAGTCPLSGGLVIMRLRGDKNGDRQFAVALTAQAISKSVRVAVNDTITDSGGSCYLAYINIAD